MRIRLIFYHVPECRWGLCLYRYRYIGDRSKAIQIPDKLMMANGIPQLSTCGVGCGPLIWREISRDSDTGLWFAGTDHVTWILASDWLREVALWCWLRSRQTLWLASVNPNSNKLQTWQSSKIGLCPLFFWHKNTVKLFIHPLYLRDFVWSGHCADCSLGQHCCIRTLVHNDLN